ncbi:terminase large subunit [Tenacibaculum maritimum]|uniref:terminase large subunit n=1 Tax=Tenacibaculum maritimum TaxID=107401 RepID=UPI00388F0E56
MNYGVTEVFVKQDYFSSLRVKLLKKTEKGYILLQDNIDSVKEIGLIDINQKVYDAPGGFLSIPIDFELKYIYQEGEYSIPRYKYILHKGSSRSSKSWSIEEWCIRKCETTKNYRINVWRDTRTSLADSVWKDFRKLFPLSGRNYKFTKNTVPIYFSTGSMLEPHGADSTNAHGITQDVAWLNEPYKISKETFDQIDQRAEQIILDLNPKAKHWSDKIAKHPRCKVIHSTFMNNPFCPPEQKRKILSYDPDNPINVSNGTADSYNWQVYGLGVQAEKPNKIYKGWKMIPALEFDKLPYKSYYGLDFGETNPTALVEVKYHDGIFYIKELLYKSGKEIDSLSNLLNNLGIEKGKDLIICDSASPDKINELRQSGFYAIGASKPKGSVVAGISFINKMKVFYTKNSDNLDDEYNNYEWELDRYGLPIDNPLKKDDHLMDAIRYVISYLKTYLNITV